MLARECSPIVASRYGFACRLLILPYLEAHTHHRSRWPAPASSHCGFPHHDAPLTMVLTISIKNQVPYEDVHDTEEEMKFIQYNVVKGDVNKRRQHTSQVLGTRGVGLCRQVFHLCRVRAFFDVSVYTF